MIQHQRLYTFLNPLLQCKSESKSSSKIISMLRLFNFSSRTHAKANSSDNEQVYVDCLSSFFTFCRFLRGWSVVRRHGPGQVPFPIPVTLITATFAMQLSKWSLHLSADNDDDDGDLDLSAKASANWEWKWDWDWDRDWETRRNH